MISIPDINVLTLLDNAVSCSKKAKLLLDRGKFYESFGKSYGAIYSTVKAVAGIGTDTINPINLLVLVEEKELDVVFFDALSKAIALGEKTADASNELISQSDAQELFDFSIMALKKAREIHSSQKS